MGGVSWGGKGVVWCLKKKRHHKTEMDARYFVAATLICILTSWWVAGGRFLCSKDEKGGKPNQTYANQPKSLKGSK